MPEASTVYPELTMSLYFILNDNLDLNLSTPKNSQMQFNIYLKLTSD